MSRCMHVNLGIVHLILCLYIDMGRCVPLWCAFLSQPPAVCVNAERDHSLQQHPHAQHDYTSEQKTLG